MLAIAGKYMLMYFHNREIHAYVLPITGKYLFTAGAVSIATISEKGPRLKLKYLLSDT
jgi:hypothetical protein